jgi:hypothetical protein
MSSTTAAIGALVLVPIAIAASAAYIAIKTTEGYKRLSRYCNNLWLKSPLNQTQNRRRRKCYGSDISSSQAYADSWVDLESVISHHEINTFINQKSPQRYESFNKEKSEAYDTVQRVWHPPRNNRLMWSFADLKSQGPRHSGLSSVTIPLPVLHRLERSSTEDGDFQIVPMRAGEARPQGQTDH